MSVPDGIQNLYVKVSTDNDSFKEAAGYMGLTTGSGLDLTSQAATDLSELFSLPQTGDTNYSFILNSTLLGLLTNYPGIHNFMLTVIDQNNQQASATLTVRVTE